MLLRLLGEDIELLLVTSAPADNVLADPSQIEQIIMNLAVNARDAMVNGGRLTLEVGNVELDASYAANHVDVVPGPYVMLAVTDTGAGIDPATRERIFEPFFTTKEPGKGTGLGLSTVFGIVQQSRGHIYVYSELGIGTTFKVYFPRTDRAVETIRPVVHSTEPLQGSETVLLVEDDALVRRLHASILQRNGYHVLEAENGADALLESAKVAQGIDLLLTDVVMPRLNGRQLAEQLRAQQPTLKVLYVSGYTRDSVIHHGLLEPGIAFVQKPIAPNSLLRTIRELLDGRSKL
jgi:CheY-like chemotaxis protein